MREGIAILAFTDRGEELAKSLCADLGGTADRAGGGLTLAAWTQEHFPYREALLFVGAAGIAVRAIAPFVKSKTEDPAVLCLTEDGRFVIPLLSGHLGGANALAVKAAALTGGEAVITTATDVNRVFAVDLWAKKQGLLLPDPAGIKTVSAKILRGESVTVRSDLPIRGEPPASVTLGEEGDAALSFRRQEGAALQLVPPILTLGVGCRRGIEASALEAAFSDFCEKRNILPQAIRGAASIDIKCSEPGLLSFCAAHGWEIAFYSAGELQNAPGDFTSSAFVREQTGVDNVCERAAVLNSGGALVEKKYAAGGVTFALAAAETAYDWST